MSWFPSKERTAALKLWGDSCALKFLGGGPDPQDLRRGLHLAKRFQRRRLRGNEVARVALVQPDWGPYEKRGEDTVAHRGTAA